MIIEWYDRSGLVETKTKITLYINYFNGPPY